MIIFLAALCSMREHFDNGDLKPEEMFALESYYSLKPYFIPYINRFKFFMLDSGAFSFLTSVKHTERIDWYEYAAKYADFVRNNNIRLYMELDIDGLVGLPEVERLRSFIEKRVGWKSIPVWHLNRGKDYFLKMCDEYDYVAIGGLVSKKTGIGAKLSRMFPWFINEAHKRNTKIHGLGFTILPKLREYHFDSVDSTSWSSACRYGEIHKYENGTIKKHCSVQNGIKVKAIKNPKDAQLFSLRSWVTMQHYAEKNL